MPTFELKNIGLNFLTNTLMKEMVVYGIRFANMISKYYEKAGVEKIPLRAFHSLRRFWG